MKGMTWAGWLALSAMLLLPLAAGASTISPGEERVVHGTVSAVDVAHRAVVVEVPIASGDLTVGVTLDSSVTPQGPSGPVSLSEVQPGAPAMLRYTRRDDRLVGLAFQVQR